MGNRIDPGRSAPTPPAAQGWWDEGSDTTIINGAVSSPNWTTDVYYHDANGNGRYDPGETIWVGSGAYDTADTILAGSMLPEGATGTGHFLMALTAGEIEAGTTYDAGKIALVDPAEIKGVQGQLAYRDIAGVGYWQAGDPILAL